MSRRKQKRLLFSRYYLKAGIRQKFPYPVETWPMPFDGHEAKRKKK